jgi:hypothetical protein
MKPCPICGYLPPQREPTEQQRRDEQTAKECESRFQNGDHRVQTLKADGTRSHGAHLSGRLAVRMADDDESVWQRVKRATRYIWVCKKRGKS